jgi:transcription-repair coupling factor (superfamily II helicase)
MKDNVLSTALQQRFLHCPQYARLLARTARGAGGELHVTGLADSAKSLVVSMLFQEVRRPFFLVTSDSHQADRYYQEISNLSRFPVFLYPASEVSPYEQVLSSPDTISGQMEVLLHILKTPPDQPYVVVVPARALTQRVLDAADLGDSILEVKVGQPLEPAALARRLALLGYTRESLVTLRGEFSVRGDIVDIFPAAGPPVRIELFGDEVESVRLFNVENQRSYEQADRVSIPPRWWIVVSDPEWLAARLGSVADSVIDQMDDEAAETLKAVMNSDLPAIEAGRYPESIEYYAPYVHERFATIANYISEAALVLFDEWDTVAVALSSYADKLDKGLEEGLSEGRLLPLPRPLHMGVSEITDLTKGNQRAYLQSMPHFAGEGGEVATVAFDCHGVERFNGQMQQFAERVRQWQREGYRVVISSEQPQRLLGILKEWDCRAGYLSGPHDPPFLRELSETKEGSSLADLVHGQASALKVDPHGVKYREDTNEAWVTRYGFAGGFRLVDVRLVSVTDVELFGLKRKPTTYRRPIADKGYDRFTSVADLKVGDYVVHVKQGIGQFSGIQRISVDGQQREYLTVQYAGEDRLYVPVDQINLLMRYRGSGEAPPRLSRLGGAEWESTKRRVKRSVKQLAEDLINLYAIRAKQEGFASLPDTPWQYEMEEAFPYEETPDQWQAILDTKSDLESSKPMDRLICGDVGFGKTEVAIRAIFKVIMSGKQAAVLVPTTILAQQHFNTLCERFAPYPIRVGLLSRFRTAREQKEVVARLATGECDVVVGTHRLLQKDIVFKDLGLVVIDEEHRFGVGHKEKLKQLRVMVDVLTMSATPIPRTLHMALSAARDMSLINTPPVNRAPVKTYVGEYKPALVRTAILHEMERGGQAFFVHNRVETIENIAWELKNLVPEARIAVAHGQMQERDLENVMLDFQSHQYDILVCTTIIESGLDMPNVNTIVLDEADKLGLAQLYQLRGRVGRCDVQAYAYCLFRPSKVLSDTAQNRLKAIREFTSLGSGYQIALRDMEIRGVGNILGAEQHGHMISVGFDLYCKLLAESVAELKGQAVSAEPDTQVDINVTAFIPETYMADHEQKIIEYKRLADVRSERELTMLTQEWRDRFGPVPQETEQLIAVVRLRLLASRAGVSSIKPDTAGLRLGVGFRLQQWLPIQARLPKHLASRTTYKPGSPGGHGPTPYILVRALGTSPAEQVSLLEELLSAMVAYQQAQPA